MIIRQYHEKFKQAFVDLNIAWIEKYFSLEDEDREIIEHVDAYLEKGAMIYFAIEDDNVLATCMIIPTDEETWEVAKLATDEKYQGNGAGSAVFKACIDYAREKQAKKITLVSNKKLKPAIHLYEKFGFKEVFVDRIEYDRCDYQAELIFR
ncbi:hypothetical protein NRIC_29870 [Enterococcus florum]|uniref:N-acetyltransferase domain-containing protein n=1 Tax=Enterococcus florum TaxID=2480627 RepID=A0A4P5PBJ4_9ENTE|nr:GNAT family N-acetyltransferase [Enterococcus florum]GCF95096.1 hypothetical protein NRIC_29870 [Enterococcus florum]